MANWDDIETINTKLETELDTFKTLMKNAVDPATWDDYGYRWAVRNDDEWDYIGHVLNIDKKTDLDDALDDYTGDDSYAQQQLHLLEESIPTDPDELEIKNSEIEYISTWLELMHTLYNNFLDTVTIDDECLDDKWDRVREELKEEYMGEMKEEYADVAETDGEWSRSYGDYWRMDEECEPDEDFVTDWLYKNC